MTERLAPLGRPVWRWTVAALMATVLMLGCEPQKNPDPPPTGEGPERYRVEP